MIVKTPTLMNGYLNDINSTNKTISQNDKILYTGDLFYKYKNHYFFSGRKKRIISRAGEKIYPYMIEKSIVSFPSVHDAWVEGKYHEIYGEVPIVYIVANNDLNISLLKRHLMKKIPKSFIPVEWNIVSELPKRAYK